MADDKIEKLVTILLELKGSDEVQKDLEKMYETATKGNRDAKKSSEDAEPKIARFLERWKTQALTLGAAIAGLWTLTKYSSVASGMVNMLGASIGLLGDMLLVHLVDPAAWASEKILELAEWFEALPEPIQKLASYVLGLYGAFKVLKALGITGIFSSIAKGLLGLAGIDVAGGIIAGLETAMAGGGAAAAAAWLAAVAAGLAIGLAGVAALVYSGALDWVSEMGRAFEEKCPWFMDLVKSFFAPALALIGSLGIAAIDLVSGRIDKIPEDVGRVLDDIKGAMSRTGQRIMDRIKGGAEMTTTLWSWAWGKIKDSAVSTFTDLFSWVTDKIRGVVDWIGGFNPFASWKMPSFSMPSLPKLPFFASGGHVEQTGLAMLHRGEYVTSSFKAKTRDGVDREAGRIQIQQVVLQGKFESEYDMYRRFITLLEREGRRAI